MEQSQTRRGKLLKAVGAFIAGAVGASLLYPSVAGMLTLLAPSFAFRLSLTLLAGLTGGTLVVVKYPHNTRQLPGVQDIQAEASCR